MQCTRWIGVVGLLLAACVPVSAHAQTSRETVRERLWMWAHATGVYNDNYLLPLGRKSTIAPVDAVQWMGLRNVMFIRYAGHPQPPFETYYQPFQRLDRVYWSLVGASGATSENEREAVFRLARQQPNLAGFMLDDFFHGHATGNAAEAPAGATPFDASLTPAQLRQLHEKAASVRKLPIMAVVYTGQISPRAKAHLDQVDQVSLWTWRPADLAHLEANLTALETLIPGKPIFLGCYTYDFADRRPIPMDSMRRQVELGFAWLKAGRIEGMIFLATPNVDVGLEAVAWTRDWIARVGDQPLTTTSDTSR